MKNFLIKRTTTRIYLFFITILFFATINPVLAMQAPESKAPAKTPPTKVLTLKIETEDTENSEETEVKKVVCLICKKLDGKDLTILSCSHAFHNNCLASEFLLRSQNCPQCHAPAPVFLVLALTEDTCNQAFDAFSPRSSVGVSDAGSEWDSGYEAYEPGTDR